MLEACGSHTSYSSVAMRPKDTAFLVDATAATAAGSILRCKSVDLSPSLQVPLGQWIHMTSDLDLGDADLDPGEDLAFALGFAASPR